jgi:hypothetical protein
VPVAADIASLAGYGCFSWWPCGYL